MEIAARFAEATSGSSTRISQSFIPEHINLEAKHRERGRDDDF